MIIYFSRIFGGLLYCIAMHWLLAWSISAAELPGKSPRRVRFVNQKSRGIAVALKKRKKIKKRRVHFSERISCIDDVSSYNRKINYYLANKIFNFLFLWSSSPTVVCQFRFSYLLALLMLPFRIRKTHHNIFTNKIIAMCKYLLLNR